MRRLLAVCALALAVAAPARAGDSPGDGVPEVDASAYAIVDARTGEVLASSNLHAQVPIASITKLMTVRLALEHLDLDDVVSVDPRAAAVGESSIDLEAGERISVRDLLEGALIQSANDAADALALAMAPDYPSFARMMNAEAAKLGLADSNFVRPDGLDAAGEHSSVFDVTKLARLVMRSPFVRRTVDMKTATISGGRTLHTWDDLLTQFPQTFGVKTGHTSSAGWCQVAAARGRNAAVYATILGSPTRAQRNDDLESLLVWGLDQFRTVPAVSLDRVYADVRLPYGRAPLGLVVTKPMLTVVRVGRTLRETVRAKRAVALPVHAGDVLGTVEIRSGSRLVGTRPLVASRTVARPGLGGRLGWYAKRTLHHLAHLL